MIKKILVFFATFFLIFIITETGVKASCTERENCPFENYPYCVENVPFTECFDQSHMCWESGTVDEQGYVDCAYTYRPSPTPTPLPSSQCGHEGEACCEFPQVACQEVDRLECVGGTCIPRCEIPCPCISFEVGPREGSSNTLFTLHTERCGSPDGSGRFILQVVNDQDEVIKAYEISGSTPNITDGYQFVGPNQRGTFTILLYYSYELVGQGSITITSLSSLECGDLTDPNDTERCPNSCVSLARGNFWWCSCGGLNQPACPPDNYFGDPPCQPGLTDMEGVCVRMDTISGEYTCSDGVSIRSAIGCIPVLSLRLFIEFWLTYAMWLSGGVAFLFIIYAIFLFATSRTNEEQLKHSREIFFAAITGITLLVFAVFVFRLLGVDILKLPSFS